MGPSERPHEGPLGGCSTNIFPRSTFEHLQATGAVGAEMVEIVEQYGIWPVDS
jgi:hypothetical protein